MVNLTRPLRAFNVATYGDGKTGPLDHSSIFTGTRAEFHALVQHATLAPGQSKEVVGAWCPVDARTRANGGSFTTRGGKVYEESSVVARQLENVTGSSASVFLDIDKVSSDEWLLFLAAVRGKGWNGLAWSTASCTAETVSARVLLHLDRELTSADEVRRTRMAVSQVLGNMGDPMTFQAVAVFYKPATRGFAFVEVFDGENEIAVDALPQVATPPRALRSRPMLADYVVDPKDLARAEEELDSLARRIRSCTSGLRRLTELASYHVGHRVAAGVLAREAAIAVLSAAVRYQNTTHGDLTASLEERLYQISSGMDDGIAAGASLPAEDPTPRERLSDAAAAPEVFIPLAAALTEAARLAATGEAAILALPPGAGKTRAILEQIATDVLPATIYTPSHELAEEHRAALIALGVAPDTIHHEMSPLHRPKGGQEACARSVLSREAAGTPDADPSPFAVTVRGARVQLRASICPTCPTKDDCDAFKAKPQRDVQVRLSVHAAYRSPEAVDVGKRRLVLDEEPAPLELLRLTRAELNILTGKFPGVLSALTGKEHWNWTPTQVDAAKAARQQEAKLAEQTVSAFDPGQAYYVRQAALALKAGRRVAEDVRNGLLQYAGSVRLSKDLAVALAEHPGAGLPVGQDGLAVIQTVVRLGASNEAPVRQPDGSLQAVVPTAARRDVIRGTTRLLSATPTPGAYGSLAVYAPQVQDGCPDVQRTVLYHCEASNTEMKSDPTRALARAARLLVAFPLASSARPVLVVTHKLLVDLHSDTLAGMFQGRQVVFRHFGNVAGSNLFQEGGDAEVGAIVTLGDYYANRRWLFDHLAAEAGLEGEDAYAAVQAAGRKQIAQELAQAHGRARDPRRRTPIEHVHIGREVPDGWVGRFQLRALRESREEKQEHLRLLLRLALTLHAPEVVATRCEVRSNRVSQWKGKHKPIAERHEPALRELAGLGPN